MECPTVILDTVAKASLYRSVSSINGINRLIVFTPCSALRASDDLGDHWFDVKGRLSKMLLCPLLSSRIISVRKGLSVQEG